MSISPSLIVSAALAGVLLAHGCATVSSSVMVPQDITVSARSHGGSVRIDTNGSARQAFIGKRLVTTEALKSAVRDSVLAAQVFDEVINAGPADRILSVDVERIEEPDIGLDVSCTVALRWRLLSGDRSRTLWEEVIQTKETITSFDEKDSSKRGRMAIETALRSNLQRGMRRLSEAG